MSTLVSSLIAVADNLTTSMGLQASVTHYAWTANGSTYGEPTYATGVARNAIVEMKQRLRRLAGGQEVLQQASVTFPRPITANGATGRREPIDPRDKIVLPNGYTGPILSVEGLENPDTTAPYMLEVILG